MIDVAGGDKVPRKGGPGVTTADLLVINKTDLAPFVNADLGVMDRDAKARRGDLPIAFTSLVEPAAQPPWPTGCGPSSTPGAVTRRGRDDEVAGRRHDGPADATRLTSAPAPSCASSSTHTVAVSPT